MVNKSDLRISNFNNKKKINAMIHVMPSYINGEISVHSLLIKFTNMSHPNNNIRNCFNNSVSFLHKSRDYIADKETPNGSTIWRGNV